MIARPINSVLYLLTALKLIKSNGILGLLLFKGNFQVQELNALRADFTNLQHNKDLHRRNIAIQAYGV
jgi:hypothetical protein